MTKGKVSQVPSRQGWPCSSCHRTPYPMGPVSMVSTRLRVSAVVSSSDPSDLSSLCEAAGTRTETMATTSSPSSYAPTPVPSRAPARRDAKKCGGSGSGRSPRCRPNRRAMRSESRRRGDDAGLMGSGLQA